MPSQDAQHASDRQSPGSAGRRLSRRSVLQGAATAGAAGLVASSLGAAASPAVAATGRPSALEGARGPGAAKAPAGPITVHVRDVRSGDIEVFSGTSQSRVRDRDLAARIAQAMGR